MLPDSPDDYNAYRKASWKILAQTAKSEHSPNVGVFEENRTLTFFSYLPMKPLCSNFSALVGPLCRQHDSYTGHIPNDVLYVWLRRDEISPVHMHNFLFRLLDHYHHPQPPPLLGLANDWLRQ